MKTPQTIYRTQDQCHFDELHDALEQSIWVAAEELRGVLSNEERDATDSGEQLILDKTQIVEGMKNLTLAYAGKLITTYEIQTKKK